MNFIRRNKDYFECLIVLVFLIVCAVSLRWVMIDTAEKSLAAKEKVEEVEETVEEISVVEEEIDGSEHDPDFEFVGEFVITHYCNCPVCEGKWYDPDDPRTASGTTPKAGRTVGTDWARLPAGTVIFIEDLGEYVVEDKVANWVADKYDGYIIDIFCDSHEEALDRGKLRRDVWVLEW